MSAFIFPADPFLGEEFTPENGPTYIWNGYAWDVKSPARSAPSTVIPPGVVVMWSGLLEKIPNGWALCDGNNGTPNLSGKFIMGPDSVRVMHSFGGSADSTLPLHSHSVTQSRSVATGVTDFGGEHSHTYQGSNYQPNNAAGSVPDWIGSSTMTTAAGGSHQHTFSIDVSGGVASINESGADPTGTNLPPFYVLAYIIKL